MDHTYGHYDGYGNTTPYLGREVDVSATIRSDQSVKGHTPAIQDPPRISWRTPKAVGTIKIK